MKMNMSNEWAISEQWTHHLKERKTRKVSHSLSITTKSCKQFIQILFRRLKFNDHRIYDRFCLIGKFIPKFFTILCEPSFINEIEPVGGVEKKVCLSSHDDLCLSCTWHRPASRRSTSNDCRDITVLLSPRLSSLWLQQISLVDE